MIAGTSTPIALLAIDGSLGDDRARAGVDRSRSAGIVFEWLPVRAPRGYVTAVYLTLGWIGVLGLGGALGARTGAEGVLLVAGGGVLYTIGAVVHAARRPDPWPRVFGYHEIFHAFVIAAALAALVAIEFLVLPLGADRRDDLAPITSVTTASSGTPTPTTTRPTHGGAARRAPEAWGVWRIPEAERRRARRRRRASTCSSTAAAPRSGRSRLARAAARPRRARPVARAAAPRRGPRWRRPASRSRCVCASGEHVPVADASFDVVFCDHGAMSFCDPAATLPEVARLLRPGGRFVFCHSSPWRTHVTFDARRDRTSPATPPPLLRARARSWSPRAPSTSCCRPASGSALPRRRTRRSTTWSSSGRRRGPRTPTDWDARWARRWPAEHLWVLHQA